MESFFRLFLTALLFLNSMDVLSQSEEQNVSLDNETKTLADTVQFNSLFINAKNIYRTNPQKAIEQLKTSLAIKNIITSCSDCQMKALALQGSIYLRQNQTDSAEIIYTELKEITSAKKNLKYLSLSLNNLGSCKETKGDYLQAIELYKSAIEIKKEIKDTLGVARGLKNLGATLVASGDFDDGLKCLLEAKGLREHLKDHIGVARVLNEIGTLYKRQNDLKKALAYYVEALEISKMLKDDRRLVIPNNNIGNVYYLEKNYTKALEHYEKGLELAEATNYKYGIALTATNSGNVLLESNDYKKASNRFLRAFTLAEEMKHKYLMAGSLQSIGWCYFKQGKINKALSFTNKSIEKSLEMDELELLKDSYKNLALIYEFQKNNKAALVSWKKHYAAKDSLFNEENIRNAAEIQSKHEIAQEQLKHDSEIALKENELKLLEKEEELKSKTIWVLGFGIILIGFLGFFIWKNQRQKLKLNHNQKLISEAKLKNTILEKERMALEVEVKSKELNGFALNILQRIDFIDKLRETIKSLKSEGSNLGNEKLDLIDIKLRETQSFEQDKEIFKMKLDREQDSFLRSIEEKFPELTKDEIRLASLLRIDFSSKEIAAILNIEPKSVDMKRYRLRKKMGLGKDVNLNEFLKLV
nr:tetratricopeptide repeat protein [uncultured Psychroserpens sp.]